MNPLSKVKSWLYHLGEANSARIAEIGASNADMVVIDYAAGDQTPYTPAQVEAMRGTNDKLVVSYLSIGEAEQYRNYWKPEWQNAPPSFIAEPNPEWTDNFKVAYWDPAWKEIIKDYVDDIIKGGFNGVYLDIVDGYMYWEEKNPGRGSFYRDEMVKFVAEIRAHAKKKLAAMGDTRDFAIIGQNGEDLADDPNYLAAVDGIGKEDLYFYYQNGSPGDFGQVPDGWLKGSQELLEKAEAAGVEVFAVEYIPPRFEGRAAVELQREIAYLKAQGIPLYVAEERDLKGIYDIYSLDGDAEGGGSAGMILNGTSGSDVLAGQSGNDEIWGKSGADSLSGKNGDDVLDGAAGRDVLNGGEGDDLLRGGGNADRLNGGSGLDDLLGGDGADQMAGGTGDDYLSGGKGNDRLLGGTGDDELQGGTGADTFVFSKDWGSDIIMDFRVGIDRLSVTDAGDYSVTRLAEGILLEFDGGGTIELRGVTGACCDELF